MNIPLAIRNVGVVCALGTDKATILKRALAGDTSGMKAIDVLSPEGTSRFGFVPAEGDASLSRCNALINLALAQIAPDIAALFKRHAPERVGVVVGTSNADMEEFTANPVWNNMASPALHLARATGARGPAFAISTACSSSAKAFASARKLIFEGVCDAALVCGADASSRVVTNGFAALEALSPALTRPLAADRDGINLGEGAAVFIVELGTSAAMLLGAGESSDAYHQTAPDPSGKGAEAAMRAALADAMLSPDDVGWVQLHGTGTVYNDVMEMGAVNRVFGDGVAVSSTKPLTGHTLGAAGAVSVALAFLALEAGMAIPHAVADAPLNYERQPDALKPEGAQSAPEPAGGAAGGAEMASPEIAPVAVREPLPLNYERQPNALRPEGATGEAETAQTPLNYERQPNALRPVAAPGLASGGAYGADGGAAELPPNPRVRIGERLGAGKAILINAFAFGGSNASVIIGPPMKPSLAALLPHKAPMIVLSDYDRGSLTESGVRAFVDVTERDVFYDAAVGGVPGEAALEYMAQTMAVFIGAAALRRGERPRLGFVLGSRKLELHLPRFEVGRRYAIDCEMIYNDAEFASFRCEIRDGAGAGAVVAEGTLNAFQPESIEEFQPK